MGEPSKGDASVIEDDSLVWLKELTLFEPYLKEAPFEQLCGDALVRPAPTTRLIDSISTNLA